MADAKRPPIDEMTDQQLSYFHPNELIKIIRNLQKDKNHMLMEQNRLMMSINKKLQTHLTEIRGLKEVNQKLQDDNQELRDVCCFLDDDRQRGRKLVREWQRFGKYTSSVMKTEVSAYQVNARILLEYTI